ncbi:hypothetical protein [Micromonospora sp. NBC_01813]|uniref:hypothetical protein n=1 Tax=Micromonospora sp. NBC_01813 TaxID=2975988 RepID=UPI002DD909A7|nr:hypothetical protein [Micromonospora sp. NBC_01813]WSA07517.1 hypothetical protein OG958_25195 [Micromonospora sp. NBC_01813]
MSRKRRTPVAASFAMGVLLLASCGSITEVAPPPPPVVDPAAGGNSGEVDLVSGTAKSNEADPNSGDLTNPMGGPAPEGDRAEAAMQWVELRKSKAGALDPVVVNGAKLTLYRFDDDEAKPSKATCAGDCATTWPPVLIKPGGRVFVAGVKHSNVSTVTRDDGTLQLTIAGWPVYRFIDDTKAGDTNGHGVGGTWFAIRPDGKKATPDPEADNGGIEVDPLAPPATDATFFSDANFGDNGFAEGLSGSGCLNLGTTAGEASSMTANGSVRMWRRPDCQGDVVVANGDVPDLAQLGVDDSIQSIRLG